MCLLYRVRLACAKQSWVPQSNQDCLHTGKESLSIMRGHISGPCPYADLCIQFRSQQIESPSNFSPQKGDMGTQHRDIKGLGIDAKPLELAYLNTTKGCSHFQNDPST